MRVLACMYGKNGAIGAAYSTDESTACVVGDTPESGPYFRTLESLLFKAQPHLVIVPARTSSIAFLDHLTLICGKFPSTIIDLAMSNRFRVQIQDNWPDYLTLDANILACGALSCLQRFENNIHLPVIFESSDDYIKISSDVIRALSIVCDGLHPNSYFEHSKVGLSISSLILSHCKSSPGRSLLRHWILNPVKNVDILNQRYDLIEKFIKNYHSKGLMPSIAAHLRRLPTNLTGTLHSNHAQPCTTLFTKILDFINACIGLGSHLIGDWSFLIEIAEKINETIDIRASEKQCRPVIRVGLYQKLDDLKMRYSGLPMFLKDAVEIVAKRVKSDNVTFVNIVYFPQLGFLVTIPKNADNPHTVSVMESKNPEFQMQFETDKIIYFKDPTTRHLDESIGDVYADIVDVELDILNSLTSTILSHADKMKVHYNRLIEIDCIQALTDFAVQNQLTRPDVRRDGASLSYKAGRHLLQERVISTYVPNEFNPSSNVTIITGPNSSGKSIFMKQTALIVYMAQIGSFVPAKDTVIGVVDAIYARIQTREGASRGMSAFQTDLAQVKEAIDGCTKQSLVLVDEFGKGTDSEEGMALMAAMIKYLADPNFERGPRTIAITHFFQIKSFLDESLYEDKQQEPYCQLLDYPNDSKDKSSNDPGDDDGYLMQSIMDTVGCNSVDSYNSSLNEIGDNFDIKIASIPKIESQSTEYESLKDPIKSKIHFGNKKVVQECSSSPISEKKDEISDTKKKVSATIDSQLTSDFQIQTAHSDTNTLQRSTSSFLVDETLNETDIEDIHGDVRRFESVQPDHKVKYGVKRTKQTVKNNATQKLKVCWMCMDVVEYEGKMVFLYRATSGKCADSSLAIKCALNANIPSDVCSRATDLLKLYDERATPLMIRYASVDPKLESASVAVVSEVMGCFYDESAEEWAERLQRISFSCKNLI